MAKGIGRMTPVAQENRWRAEDDLRTLQRADQIRTDKSRITAASTVAKEQMKALQTIAGAAPAKGKAKRSKPAGF